MNEIHSFLKGLKEIGRSKSEIRSVRSKINDFTGILYRYRPLPNKDYQPNKDQPSKEELLQWRTDELEGKIYIQPNKELNDAMDMVLTVKSTDTRYRIRALKKDPISFIANLMDMGYTFKEIINVFRLNPDKAYDFIRKKQGVKFGKYIESNFDNIIYDDTLDDINLFNLIFSFSRIACFTETHTNMPMWYYYANNYNGMCFEYKIDKSLIMNKFFPVIYTNDLPDMYDTVSSAPIRDTLSLFSDELKSKRQLYKNNDWSYEKEWRYIDSEVNFYWDKLSDFIYNKFLDELPLDNRKRIERKLISSNNQNSLKELFKEMNRNNISIFDFMGKFYKQLPLYEGKKVDFIIPCKIYLGHKIEPENEKYITNYAKKLKIEVCKMSLTPTGYQSISIEEAVQGDSQIFIREAEKYFENSQYEDAIKKCTESIETFPNVYAYITRGNCYLKTERLELASKDYKDAIKLEPTNPLAHGNLGNLYNKQGNKEKAIEEYRFSLSYFKSIQAYINLTVVYMDGQKYGLAIETIKEGLKNCNNFANKFCENSYFKESLERHPSFIKSIREDPVLSRTKEFIRKL